MSDAAHALLIAAMTGVAVAGGAGWLGLTVWRRDRRSRRADGRG
ncbi:MAG TPA: hypothetical protein VFO60_00160 [Candidatus Dormibacteraeota bacterium]|nr:hypothetical protein [Candidatus Dormibacteraeota bacterium]